MIYRLDYVKENTMFELTILIIIGLCSLVLGMALTPLVVRLSYELHLFDLPDGRKVHKLPIPRTGGVAFAPVAAIVIAVSLVILLQLPDYGLLIGAAEMSHLIAYLSGFILLFITGLYDDLHGISYHKKFVAQILSGIVLCFSGLWINSLDGIFNIYAIPDWLGLPFTVLVVVFMTNAMNLIDGIDGLASGIACLSFCLLAYLGLASADFAGAVMSVSFIGVLLAFFYFNVFSQKYKVFMGDSGSLTLGFTLSFLILQLWQRNVVASPSPHHANIIALSTLIVPLFDVVRVFFSRIRKGRNPFLPDKNHIHHKLMYAGLNAGQALFVILLISVLFVITNWLLTRLLNVTFLFTLDVILYALLHLVINHFIAKEGKEGRGEAVEP